MRRDLEALRRMLDAERLPASTLAAMTEARSAEIALHAFRTTEYYRAAFSEAGFRENDVAQPQNFTKLPIVTKTQIQDAGLALASSGSTDRDRLVSTTGGSTGRPLRVFNDRQAPVAALWWRIYSWWGVAPADNVAFIYRQSRQGLKKLAYDAQWWPTRHVLLDARGTTTSSMEAFGRQVTRLRPRLLVGYVEGIREFAEYVDAERLELPGLTAISVTASMLHRGQRGLIEKALRAPVFDTYRSAEVPWIAAECTSQNGLHVLADRRRVDLVSESGGEVEAGEVGNVLITDFDNGAFPLIRYAIGDRSRWHQGACTCGRSLPRITALEGRIADVLRTPSGRIVSGGNSTLFNAWPGIIRQFQIHQAADFTVTIRYVAGSDPPAARDAAEEVAGVLTKLLNGEVQVRSQATEQIAAVDGKARLVVSDVPRPRESTDDAALEGH